MDASLIHKMESSRLAASQAVASGLAPRNTAHTAHSAAKSSATAHATSSTSSSTSAAGSTSNITTSDFLTLLVTELQNQDPTQPTDPNTYITQLAQVNSLEQLIDINSDLTNGIPVTPVASTSSTATGKAAYPVTNTPAS